MQKCENKAVCVKPGLGVTPVPEQVGVSVAPPAAHPSQLSAVQAGSSLGTATAALGGTLGGISPLEERPFLWETPNLTSCCWSSNSAPLPSIQLHPAAARPSMVRLQGTCVCFSFIFQHQICSSGYALTMSAVPTASLGTLLQVWLGEAEACAASQPMNIVAFEVDVSFCLLWD